MMKRFTTCLVIMTLMSYSVKGDVRCLTPTCKCTLHKAVCTGSNLTYVPRFPKEIRWVTIMNANLSNIEENGFFNLTFNYLVNLILINNSIEYISPRAFDNLTNLIKLQISSEKSLDMDILKQALHNMDKKMLKSLSLANNGWEYLPFDMFKSFEKSNIKYIRLPGNNFQDINGSIFSNLSTLQYLNLQQNRIEKVLMKGLHNIRDLNLAQNQLVTIPEWCDHEKKSFVPNLETLHLSYNFITRMRRFRCLPRLSFLSLENNFIGEIPENVFSELHSLQERNLKALGKPVKKIKPAAFNISSLRSLTFGECNFHFDKLNSQTLSCMFSLCSSLQVLNMENNFLPSDTQSFWILFKPLTKLIKLHLDSCKLYELPVGVFQNFHFITVLSLAGNNLYAWENGYDVFGNMTSLRYLDISKNRINIVNDTSFPVSTLSKLQRINLSYNPYYCTCDQMWFVDWLRQTNISVEGYPEKYRCVQPADMANTLLKDYRPTIESCTPWNPLYIIIISISSFGIFVIILVFIIFKCQTNIKNYFYLLRIYRYTKKGYLPINNADDYEYHAFIVYCDADRLWVHNEFVKRLEIEEGLKLCIHHRDFEAGETISGNVDNFLKKSWKVVVIMSNDFAKSEWCQWEVDIVQERRRRQGRDVFLLVMLKNITSKYMTSPLRTLLDCTPHLRYQKGVGEDIFWKAVVEGLRKPIGHPPVSVL